VEKYMRIPYLTMTLNVFLFDAILIFKLYQLLAFPSKDQSVPCGMTELPHFVVAGSQLLVTGIRMNRNRT
jgi:hypothetical protein